METLKKAAFFKIGSFSHINDSVLNELKNNFPDYQFDVLDLNPEKYSLDVAEAILYCIKEYGKEVLLGKRTLRGTFARTTYYFNKRREFILLHVPKEKYAFTFQTQSLFDASIPGVPHFLYTDHTHLANLQYPGFDKSLILHKNWIEFENTIYQHTNLIFTMSSNISRSLISDYCCCPDKVRCVYCGSNVAISRDEVFNTERYFRKKILFVGVNWERKGGPVLAEAFKQVLAVHPDASLTIVGCSPRLHLPNCRVTGRVSLNEIKRFYKESSVFCLPTNIEPFGIVFLEAMAHKLPIVATNIGAIPDFVHDGRSGYLVDPNNPAQLAASLIKMLSSPGTCRSFGEYGNRLFWERYTWKETGLRMRENILPYLS